MKWATQIFAVVLTGLLSAAPAWTAVSCTLGNAQMGTSCPMGMAQMDPDCPMSHSLAMDCSQDCCNRATPQAVVIPGIPAKSKIVEASPASESLAVVQATASPGNAGPASLAAAASPPRYLLLRVFRI